MAEKRQETFVFCWCNMQFAINLLLPRKSFDLIARFTAIVDYSLPQNLLLVRKVKLSVAQKWNGTVSISISGVFFVHRVVRVPAWSMDAPESNPSQSHRYQCQCEFLCLTLSMKIETVFFFSLLLFFLNLKTLCKTNRKYLKHAFSLVLNIMFNQVIFCVLT